jgi:hypothetical protein
MTINTDDVPSSGPNPGVGVYTRSAFSSSSFPGRWQVSNVTVTDRKGNQAVYQRSQLLLAGYRTDIRVIGREDSVAPYLDTLSLLSASVLDVRAVDQFLIFNISISGCSNDATVYFIAVLSSPSQRRWPIQITRNEPLVARRTDIRTYTITTQVFRNSRENGTWSIIGAAVQDQQLNYRAYGDVLNSELVGLPAAADSGEIELSDDEAVAIAVGVSVAVVVLIAAAAAFWWWKKKKQGGGGMTVVST